MEGFAGVTPLCLLDVSSFPFRWSTCPVLTRPIPPLHSMVKLFPVLGSPTFLGCGVFQAVSVSGEGSSDSSP